ncbi:MAG: phosphoglycolate phosphatase [Xanthomonadales bacterium]|nr:phosphoglycolate phosphatase [Xanthomonadales bacterium]
MKPDDPMPAGTTRAVVWDLDGTLIDSLPDLHQVLTRLLAEQGHPAVDQNRVRNMIGDGAARFIERGFAAVGQRLDPQRVAELMPRFLEIYAAMPTDESHLYPGARDTLEQLHGSGIRQAVCTNKPKPVTDQVLAELGLDGIFGSVVGGGSTASRKPDSAPLRLALAELGVAAADAVMIGDSEVDLETARAAGLTAGLVTFGYARRPVGELDADFLVERLGDVPGLLETFIPAGQTNPD